MQPRPFAKCAHFLPLLTCSTPPTFYKRLRLLAAAAVGKQQEVAHFHNTGQTPDRSCRLGYPFATSNLHRKPSMMQQRLTSSPMAPNLLPTRPCRSPFRSPARSHVCCSSTPDGGFRRCAFRSASSLHRTNHVYACSTCWCCTRADGDSAPAPLHARRDVLGSAALALGGIASALKSGEAQALGFKKVRARDDRRSIMSKFVATVHLALSSKPQIFGRCTAGPAEGAACQYLRVAVQGPAGGAQVSVSNMRIHICASHTYARHSVRHAAAADLSLTAIDDAFADTTM